MSELQCCAAEGCQVMQQHGISACFGMPADLSPAHSRTGAEWLSDHVRHVGSGAWSPHAPLTQAASSMRSLARRHSGCGCQPAGCLKRAGVEPDLARRSRCGCTVSHRLQCANEGAATGWCVHLRASTARRPRRHGKPALSAAQARRGGAACLPVRSRVCIQALHRLSTSMCTAEGQRRRNPRRHCGDVLFAGGKRRSHSAREVWMPTDTAPLPLRSCVVPRQATPCCTLQQRTCPDTHTT